MSKASKLCKLLCGTELYSSDLKLLVPNQCGVDSGWNDGCRQQANPTLSTFSRAKNIEWE